MTTGDAVLTVNQLSKRFGDNPILDTVSFVVNRGERIGLVGPNGAGKSTLLHILSGDAAPDAGVVTRTPGTTIASLRQGFADRPTGSLGDLLDDPTRGLAGAYRKVEWALSGYEDPAVDPEAAASAHEAAIESFEGLGGYRAIDELTALLDQFGLGEVPFETPLENLSGGQKTRAGLAGLLSTQPDLLVLDEPTNHLDVDGLSWLRSFLDAFPGAVVMVSHDRGFLDAVTNRTLALDPESHSVTSYPGNYSAYVAARRQEEAERAAAYTRQQRDIARIEEDIRGAEHHARTIEANTIDFAVRKKAAKIARPAVVRRKKLERLLESTEYVDKPQRAWGLAVELAASSQGARDVVVIDDATIGYGSRAILRNVSMHVRHGERVALLGPNGAGKTTLIRTMIGEIPPLAGTVRLGANVQAGYFAQEQDTLDLGLTVLEQARLAGGGSEGDVRTFLHKYLFGGDMVHRRVESISYGERARLMLATLVLRGANLLVLDEPLNHLDLDAREEFEQALESFDGTQLLVLHDRYTIQRLATRSVEVRDGRVRVVDLATVIAT